ncbi:transposase [Geminicoccus sp.]|uniref:transposase n=1 Tax=Geminicoccus sp. TaxID=2024832 RepID=UPI0039C86B25
MSDARRPYPSKPSDDEWAVLEPLLPLSSGRGRPPWSRRLMVGALCYLVRSGCAWWMPPREFPPSMRSIDPAE